MQLNIDLINACSGNYEILIIENKFIILINEEADMKVLMLVLCSYFFFSCSTLEHKKQNNDPHRYINNEETQEYLYRKSFKNRSKEGNPKSTKEENFGLINW